MRASEIPRLLRVCVVRQRFYVGRARHRKPRLVEAAGIEPASMNAVLPRSDRIAIPLVDSLGRAAESEALSCVLHLADGLPESGQGRDQSALLGRTDRRRVGTAGNTRRPIDSVCERLLLRAVRRQFGCQRAVSSRERFFTVLCAGDLVDARPSSRPMPPPWHAARL